MACGRRRRCVEQLTREVEDSRWQRRGHHGRKLRQRGRACRLTAPLFGLRAQGQSVVITSAVGQIASEFFSPSRGGVVCIAASLRSTQLRARTVALSRCVVRDDRPANARAFAYRQRRSRSAAVTPPPLHPPLLAAWYNAPFSFLDGAHARAREVGGGRRAETPPLTAAQGGLEKRGTAVLCYTRGHHLNEEARTEPAETR